MHEGEQGLGGKYFKSRYLLISIDTDSLQLEKREEDQQVPTKPDQSRD